MAEKGKSSNWLIWIIPILLLGISYLLHLPSSPHYSPMGADSGVFAFGAERILDGELLYRDVWDHKPPGVYYVNALAILIGGATPWSIWWLGVLWVALVGVVFFFVMRQLAPQVYAAIGAFVFLATLVYPQYYLDGNFSEIYSLLPQLLIFSVVYAYFRSSKERWIFIIGGLTAITMLFKQTYIAAGLASLIVVLIFRWKNGGRRAVISALLYFLVGLLLPVLLVVLIWWANGAFSDFIDATLLFNLEYARTGISAKNIYATLRTLMIVQPMSTIIFLCLCGLIFYVVDCLLQGRRGLGQGSDNLAKVDSYGRGTGSLKVKWTTACLYLAVPIEICFLFLSGRNFGHYFITPLPVFVGGGTLALFYAFSFLVDQTAQRKAASVAWASLMILLLVAWGIEVGAKVLPNSEHLRNITATFSDEVPLQPIREYILENSTADDPILVWGVHPGLNFITHRRSPTRFLTSIPLVFESSNQEAKLTLFIEDLEDDPPRLILAHQDYSAYLTRENGMEAGLCPSCTTGVLEKLDDVYQFVSSGYSQVERIGDWLIFIRNASN